MDSFYIGCGIIDPAFQDLIKITSELNDTQSELSGFQAGKFYDNWAALLLTVKIQIIV